MHFYRKLNKTQVHAFSHATWVTKPYSHDTISFSLPWGTLFGSHLLRCIECGMEFHTEEAREAHTKKHNDPSLNFCRGCKRFCGMAVCSKCKAVLVC